MAATGADPGRRILVTAAAVLRDRRQLPARDARRASAQWLQINWPDALILARHRGRLAEQLAHDADFRGEVRKRLALDGDSPDTLLRAGGDAAGEIEEAIRNAIDPSRVVERAAVHSDAAIAAAATAYLMLARALPVRRQAHEAPVRAGLASPDEPQRELRRVTKQLKAEVAALRRALRQQEKDNDRRRQESAELVSQVASQRAENLTLRGQLPSKRQQAALAAAAEHDTRNRKLARQLELERSRGADAAKTAERRLAVALNSVTQLEVALESEQRGRRRLENELGNATERARRLQPLLEKEFRALAEEASRMPTGPDRSHTKSRATRVAAVAHELVELYRLNDGPHSSGDDSPSPAPDPPSPQARTTPLALRVTALGGASHIGGSALLIEAGGTRLLVDAGLRPDVHVSRPGPERIDEALREHLDGIVVTHAHADHAGFVPWVVERSRRTPVLCSPETRALLPEVWNDSVRVMRAQAETASLRSDQIAPPYGEPEVAQAEEQLRGLQYGNRHNVGSVAITLFKAGHILGAAGVVVEAGGRRVVITGDIDDRGQASVGPAEIPPRLAAGADLLVIETTYCNRQHEERSVESAALARCAEDVLAGGGRILIPAFGLGRAQEIALLMRDQLPEVDVLIDGLARNISEIYEHNGAPAVLGGRVRKVENRQRAITGFTAGVIITTSGMLTGGAAIPWADAILREPESALFLCGHQDEESPGRELEELAASDPDKPRQVKLRDDQGRVITVPVSASIRRYNLSAHADSAGLTRIVQQVSPKAVMLVHGYPGPQAEFRARLSALGYPVVDNREPWDPAADAPDRRYARYRHGSTAGRRGRPGR